MIPETTCAFLSSFSYSRCNVAPASFVPRCMYSWKWEAIHSSMTRWTRYTCETSDAQATFCYRARDSTVFIAFRGTDSLRDLLADAWVSKRVAPFFEDNCKDARVHAGFLSQYLACRDDAVRYIGEFPERREVVVTGHSLGGALATLFAAYLRDRNAGENVSCITFGCPRVGNSAFSNYVDTLLTVKRYVVGSDPVVSIPTRIRWKHVGEKIHFGRAGAAADVCKEDALINAACLPNVFRVSDHDMSGYIDAVASQESEPSPDLANVDRAVSFVSACLLGVAGGLAYLLAR